MKANTVKLKLADYNELMDFKRDMEDNKAYIVSCGIGYTSSRIVTNDQAIKSVVEYNISLREKNTELIEKERQLVMLKTMSIWQFIKWRKTVKL